MAKLDTSQKRLHRAIFGETPEFNPKLSLKEQGVPPILPIHRKSRRVSLRQLQEAEPVTNSTGTIPAQGFHLV